MFARLRSGESPLGVYGKQLTDQVLLAGDIERGHRQKDQRYNRVETWRETKAHNETCGRCRVACLASGMGFQLADIGAVLFWGEGGDIHEILLLIRKHACK